MRRSIAVTAVALAMGAVVAVPTAASAEPQLAHIGIVRLSAAQEVPPPGDPAVHALFIFVARSDRLCYALVVQDLANPTGAHIHSAPVGVPGPIVIALRTPRDGNSAQADCIEVVPDAQQTPANATMTLTQSEEQAIMNSPSSFYVNVHNQAHPAGAARGQLS